MSLFYFAVDTRVALTSLKFLNEDLLATVLRDEIVRSILQTTSDPVSAIHFGSASLWVHLHILLMLTNSKMKEAGFLKHVAYNWILSVSTLRSDCMILTPPLFKIWQAESMIENFLWHLKYQWQYVHQNLLIPRDRRMQMSQFLLNKSWSKYLWD